MSKPVIDLSEIYKPHPRQQLAHSAVEQNVLYGGGVGGGKSWWLCAESIQLSLDYPGNRGYLCRQKLTDFRISTLLDLKRYLTATVIVQDRGKQEIVELITQHHQTENYFKLYNGSIIFYGGLGDDQGGLSRLKNMTLGWYGIDQIEESTEEQWAWLQTRLRLQLPNIHYKALGSANPAPGWVKQKWLVDKPEDYVFIPALPRDNPYLPKNYESNLRKSLPVEMVSALLDGNWDAIEGGNFVFSWQELKDASVREIVPEGDVYMGVDLAWGGSDENVAVIRQGNKVLALERWIYRKEDAADSITKITQLINQWNIIHKNVTIDAISGGALVYSGRKKLNYNVTPFVAGETADDDIHYSNRRAEMYFQLQKRLHEGSIHIPNDRDLIAQLASIKYKAPQGEKKIQLVSKEEMKKEGGHSPDRADALAMAFYTGQIKNPQIRWL